MFADRSEVLLTYVCRCGLRLAQDEYSASQSDGCTTIAIDVGGYRAALMYIYHMFDDLADCHLLFHKQAAFRAVILSLMADALDTSSHLHIELCTLTRISSSQDGKPLYSHLAE